MSELRKKIADLHVVALNTRGVLDAHGRDFGLKALWDAIYEVERVAMLEQKDAERQDKPDLEWIILKLAPWANLMAARFGHEVWLCGSAMVRKNPRDIDVRVVLPDDEFTGRYGSWIDIRDCSLAVWREGSLRWAEECGKQNRWVAKFLGLNIDFQVQSQTEVDCKHKGSPKIRLDHLGDKPMAAPKIVAICGSTRFIDTMAVAAWEEEKAGKIALSCHLLPGWYTATPHHLAEEQGVAEKLDAIHISKIDMADEVLVIDVNGYIGESTSREIAHAQRRGLPIRYWSKRSS